MTFLKDCTGSLIPLSKQFSFHFMKSIVECFDVGGTQIRGALVEDGQFLFEPVVDKTRKDNPKDLLEQIFQISQELRSSFSNNLSDERKITACSLGFPGPVVGHSVLPSEPLGFTRAIDFYESLRDKLNIKIVIGNDLNFAVLAEMKIGVGRKCKNFCLLTISTGIGIGVVIEGRAYMRNTEIGHCILETNGEHANPCKGHSGCWVAQASGSGIQKSIRKKGIEQSAEQYFENFKKTQDKDSALYIQTLRRYHAHGLGNVINAYDPEVIVIMGSVALSNYDLLIPDQSEIAKYALIENIPNITRTHLGNHIGLLGAYYATQECSV